MRRHLCTACLLVLGLASSVLADLTFPAIFKIVEQNPKQFRLTLTVPLIKGRYMKVRMIVPGGGGTSGELYKEGGASKKAHQLVPVQSSCAPGGYPHYLGLHAVQDCVNAIRNPAWIAKLSGLG